MDHTIKRDESATHRACRSFICTDRLHRKGFERLVARLGIHRSQHFLLMNIDRENTGSQKELAERLGISTAAVAVSLKKLEAEGYIERTVDDRDGRNNQIRITEAGRRVVGESKAYITLLDEAMFRGIDGDSLAVFIECLEKMKENLTQFLEEGNEEAKQ